MKRAAGHTCFGVFVKHEHLCPGFELCLVRRQIQRRETSKRHQFFAGLEGRIFQPKKLRKVIGTMVGLGATSGLLSAGDRRPNSGVSGAVSPQPGETYSIRPSSDKLTRDADSR